MEPASPPLAASALLLCCLALPAQAQGRFANFETPQTHPIEVAAVGPHDYVLVCNTPDSSIEIYEAAPPHAFVQRVPVGLGPASVRWSAALGRFLTCNFDGDSVSVVRLEPSGGSVRAVLERTASIGIGDEPSDLAFGPTGTLAAVSTSSRSSVTFLDPLSLAPLGPALRLVSLDPNSGLAVAVKMPRALAWLPDGRFFAANLRGGSPRPSQSGDYDLGLYRNDPLNPLGRADFTGGLGTTNHAFAISADGATFFVVGTKARNHAAVGVAAVSQLPTGFVQSWLMVVDVPPGGAMSVHPEAPAGGASAPPLPSIDLNRDYASPGLVPVASGDALAQPTDVLLLEDATGALERIVLSAFHSDRLALLTPSATAPGGYTIERVDLPLAGAGGYGAVGPRGVAYSPRTGLVFANGALDASLAVVDPATATLTARIPLDNDPTPAEIRAGRQFLYSNRFSIDDSQPVPRGGFVSCASCHVDARTDGLAWDLGDVVAGGPLPPGLHDPDPPGDGGDVPTFFPSEKGPMITQTLQGLVHASLPDPFRGLATNAPLHWRGDKQDFTDFNEAFVNLQGMDDVGAPGDPKGVSDADMVAYRRFVETIRHPPNPEQNLLRVTPGALGADPNDPTQASGAKLGMQLYHGVPTVGARGCADCHSLPDGSSSTLTETFPVPKTITGGLGEKHPFESAGLRNIAQREMALHEPGSNAVAQFTANLGLLHAGQLGSFVPFSINTLLANQFLSKMPGPDTAGQMDALIAFVRQLDTGTAPLAGFGYTVDPSLTPLDSGLNRIAFSRLEDQVLEANIGLGVHARNAGVERGFWFDASVDPPAYREEGGSQLLTRPQLLALALGTDSVVIAQAAPPGAERRWASPTGVAAPVTGSEWPGQLALEPLAPNTAYVDVARFDGNLNLGAKTFSSVWALRTFQQAVAGSFGSPGARHEPPRRLRVSGTGIRPGAKLLLGFAAGSQPAALPVQVLELELFPTRHTANGRRVWETELELDPMWTYALLNGGPWAPDVLDVLQRQTSTPSLQPAAWNRYLVGVRNEDGTLGGKWTDWQPLRIQDGR